MCLCQLIKNQVCNTRFIRNTENRHLYNIHIMCNSCHNNFFFHISYLLNQRSCCIGKTGTHMYCYSMNLCNFHRTRMQYRRSKCCKFQHLIIRNHIQLLDSFDNTRISRIDTVYIGIDFTYLRFHSRCNRNCCRIRTASSQSGDIIIRIDSLKSCYNHNTFILDFLLQTCRYNIDNSCLTVHIIRSNTGLLTCQRNHIFSH